MTPADRARFLDLPRIDDVPHPPEAMLHTLRPVVAAWTRRRFGVQLHRDERVPATGPVIFAANHVGWMDGPLLAIHSPRAVHALTKREMFVGGMKPFLMASGQIPIDRFGADPGAVKLSLRVLADGHAIGVFPEGARGTGELELFHPGAAYLALASGALVVPVTLIGTRDPGAGSSSRPDRPAHVDIVYGEPWQVARQPWPRRPDEVTQASASLRTAMLTAIREAKTITGRDLPGPLPAGDCEREEARKQATT